MSRRIFSIFLPIVFALSLTSCDEDENSANVSIKINPDQPLVINADTQKRSISIIDNQTVTTFVDVPGPWMNIGFDFRNDNDNAITIIALTLFITGPDGVERTATVQRTTADGIPLSVFSIVRAEKDVNCDGVVDSSEAAQSNPILQDDCEYDDNNVSFTGAKALVENMLSGADVEDFRSASYQITARFEGWVGLPTDSPEENFLKEVTFTARTN